MSTRKCAHWTQKYQPQQLSDIVGHTRQLRELREWIRNFGPSSTPIMFLYGPSGIGKTALASLLFTQYNYYIFELNAGEIRSKKRIQELMDKILSNYSVSMMKRRGRQRNIAILMDEIDGMSCGDKGGLHQLFQMVHTQYEKKQVVNPVICISNRPYDKKIPDFLYTEISLRKPSAIEIFRRLSYVCQQEKMVCQDMALQMIIHHSAHDVRKCVNFLQETSQCFPGETITLDTVENMKTLTQRKQTDYNIFDVTRALFRTRHSFQDMFQLYQIDSNLIPMMIHENLPYHLQHKRLTGKQVLPQYLFLMHNLALSDAVTNVIMGSFRWELSYCTAVLSCGYTNERICNLPSKSSPVPKTYFTNTLTKSATQSNTQLFLSSLAHKLKVPSTYFPQLFPAMVHQFLDDPTSLLAYNLEYTDVEKIVQIYQKWSSCKITAKDKKIWKRLLQKK